MGTDIEPANILIRTPNWLGDLMMATAFIQAVVDSFPAARVSLIVKQGFESLPLPQRGEIIPFDKHAMNAFAFGKTLATGSFDCIFVLPPSFSAALMAYTARIPLRIGYRENFRRLLLKPSVPYRFKPRSRHLVKEYLDLLASVGKTVNESQPALSVNKEWILDQLTDIPGEFPASYVALAPGAIYGPAKQWPVSYFRALAEKLAGENRGVVVVGTGDDLAIGNTICGNLPTALNLCGRTTLNQLIAVLAKSDLLVSNDSGTMHVMAALQKPQIAIFGSTSPVWTGPLNPKAMIVQKPIDCSPCFDRECRFGHTNCLRLITPEEVLASIHALPV